MGEIYINACMGRIRREGAFLSESLKPVKRVFWKNSREEGFPAPPHGSRYPPPPRASAPQYHQRRHPHGLRL